MASSWSSSPDYARFGQRAAALVIDALVAFVVAGPLTILVPALRKDFATFVLALFVIGFWRACGATPGKFALGIRIVDESTGGTPSLGRLVLRFLGYFVSAFPLYLGFAWAIFDRRRQGWHDKMARTIVIQSDD